MKYYHDIGRVNRTHHFICIVFRCLRNNDVQIFPDIVFQLAHVDSLSTLRIVDKLGTDPARRSLRTAEEFLLIVGVHRAIATVVNIIEGGPFIIIILEELSVERYSTAVLRYDPTSVTGTCRRLERTYSGQSHPRLGQQLDLLLLVPRSSRQSRHRRDLQAVPAVHAFSATECTSSVGHH